MPKKHKRILIVESDIETLSMIYTTLLPLDYSLEAAIDGSELRLRLERFQPDLLLLGANVGPVDNAVLQTWIEKNEQARVIGIGRKADMSRSLIRKLGIEEVLEMPISPQELLLKINHLLPVLKMLLVPFTISLLN